MTTLLRPHTQGAGPAGCGSEYEHVDAHDVLDVFLLRGARLFKRERWPGEEMVMVDELTVALDVLGRLAFVATSSDKFGYLDRHFEETMPGQWLARHMP